MTRMFTVALLILVVLPAMAFAQVDIADAGESGFGVLGNYASASGASGLGGFLSFTMAGVIDFGAGYASVDGASSTMWQMSILPLQVEDKEGRWSLGGVFRYESISRGQSRSISAYGGGPITTLDIFASPKTDFQLGGALAFMKADGQSGVNVSYSLMGGLIFKGTGANFFVMTGASLPSDGDFTTFSVQIGLFLKTGTSRDAGQ